MFLTSRFGLGRTFFGFFLAVTSTLAAAPADSAAIGLFKNPDGVSVFTEQGDSIRAQGRYSELKPRSPYFTVVYANRTCDPAQAFPVGPFITDRRGRGYLDQTAANPTGVNVGAAQSISIRIGDTAADLDGDKKTGPTDVVAVAGQPSVGLVQCDTSPFTN